MTVADADDLASKLLALNARLRRSARRQRCTALERDLVRVACGDLCVVRALTRSDPNVARSVELILRTLNLAEALEMPDAPTRARARGKPFERKWSDVEVADALASAGGRVREAARMSGIPRSVLSRRASRPGQQRRTEILPP